MATNVNEAFNQFLKDCVKIDSTRSDIAKVSKNNLVAEIQKFPNDNRFLTLHPDLSIDYGSFSRKTKIRPLDDIDLMIVLHAEGNWRNEYSDRIEISVPNGANRQLALCNDGSNTLNSIKVINKFKEYLSKVSYYDKAEIKRNQEAVTLNLKSYEWVYDIVPCFITAPLYNGTTFYLIPDGKGNWKATDPRIDRKRTIDIDAGQDASVLDVIRIMKYWTKRPTMPTMKSYFLENLILNYYSSGVTSSKFIDIEIPNILAHVHNNIHKSLNDPKGFQGNINHLTYEERNSIQTKAATDYHKAKEARQFETEGKMKESIGKWGEIFGSDFPIYTDN
jgi:hypothetical protein